MLFWLSGDLNTDQFPWVSLCILCGGLLLCWLLAPGLNLLNRGDQEARALGLAWKPYRIVLYLLSSLFTAAAVSTAGCIGFIGLIIPHISRSLLGHQHRILLPACALLGGSLLMIADTIARTVIAPQQLPVGIVTAFIGVPIFIWLLSR
jgi:iron complex transport system permease protein